MKYFFLILSLFSLGLINCGINGKTLAIEPEKGLLIKISGLHYSDAQKKVFGYVEIKNNTSGFIKVSNKELFLYCDKDTARAFMQTPGEWQIDNGLVNVIRGKSLSYDACWHLTKCGVSDDKAIYVKYLPRDEEE